MQVTFYHKENFYIEQLDPSQSTPRSSFTPSINILEFFQRLGLKHNICIGLSLLCLEVQRGYVTTPTRRLKVSLWYG